MKWITLLAVLLLGGASSYEILSYASMETEYEEFQLLVEAMWYKVPAMDIIEASVSLREPADSLLYPAFFLRYPDGETTDIANIPLEDLDCLGEGDTVSVRDGVQESSSKWGDCRAPLAILTILLLILILCRFGCT